MYESVAVLSDIHGVLPALDAVLHDPAIAECEAIIVLGDIASGPQPREVLDRLISLGDRVVWVAGNADLELVEVARGVRPTSGVPVSDWAATQLSSDHIERLATLPHPVRIAVDGFGSVLLCHGTPRSLDEIVLVDTGLTRWIEVMKDVPDSISTVVLGHTHMPFMRLAGGRRIVNPGSVGMSYGLSGAHWLHMKDGTLSFKRTVYDIERAIAGIIQTSTFPDVDTYLNDTLRHPATDTDALTAFGPSAGR